MTDRAHENLGNFVLEDQLRHRAYQFPQTMLVYPKTGKMPEKEDVLCINGEPTPYETERTEDGYNLKVITDLPYLGRREFTWKKGKTSFAPLGQDNGLLRIEFAENALFSVSLGSGEMFFIDIDTEAKLLSAQKQITGGAIESVFTKALQFEGGKSYKICLKLKRGLDFIEIYEEMSGFEKGEAKLCVHWKDFQPAYRYTVERGKEKTDAYLKEDGRFPYNVCAFMPRMSWWNVRCTAYQSKKENFWLGLLLHDLKNIDDGEYAVWGSRNSLAFDLYEERIEGKIVNGKRAFMLIFCQDRPLSALTEHYMRYYSIVSLNKVKDYVLEWEDDKKDYPKYFKVNRETHWGGFYKEHTGKPSAEDMMNILDRDATLFTKLEEIAPVSCRAFRSSWAQTFDLSASMLNDDEFARVRAAMALICYTFTDENYYPIHTLLAGHPNFLTDVVGTVAVFAALLGERHPMHKKWLAYYEIALARNLKYHVRPSVEEWGALGGRWTENIGAYMMCMLQCVVYDCHIIYTLNDGEMPLLYPHLKEFIAFLINMTAAEDEKGRRLYFPHGAHACTGAYGGEFGHGFMLAMIELADMLKNYEPLCSEYILHNFRNGDDFNAVLSSSGIYGETYRQYAAYRGGTSPDLSSCKYTGLGFMLRDHVNQSGEMSVFLQQIDEGPNYRWGRAADGGCGEIYYNANGHRYTDHAPEDVGDENRGDVQSCTNFGVLVGHEYRSVGRNDLIEPLMDFGFVKYARVNAGKHSYPYYRYRSVMMAENRYIAIYDAVADMKQHGRFSWAQSSKGEFPLIKNLRPGVNGVLAESGAPVDICGDYRSKYSPAKVLGFVGQGDFFTVVTHLRNYHDERLLYSIDKKDYGAELIFPQTKDKVFNDQARITTQEADFAFEGYTGYMTELARENRLAIFNGSFIRLKNTALTIPYDKNLRHGMSGVFADGEVCGKAVFQSDGKVFVHTEKNERAKVYIDGAAVAFSYENGAYTFTMPKGVHSYCIGIVPEPKKIQIECAVEQKDGFELRWKRVEGVQNYQIDISADGEYTFERAGEVTSEKNAFVCSGLKKGKYHVRVRGVNGKKCGEFSHPYPVYVTGERPHCPEGLRVVKQGDGFVASWGEVLGCGEYRLYRKDGDTSVLVYEGRSRTVPVQEGAYFATAVNGIGESLPSLVRSTSDERAAWDHHPELGFIRDTRSFEHGYSGFDYLNNDQKPVLNYPKNENKETDRNV